MMMLPDCQNELINKFFLPFIQLNLYESAATAEVMKSKRNIDYAVWIRLCSLREYVALFHDLQYISFSLLLLSFSPFSFEYYAWTKSKSSILLGACDASATTTAAADYSFISFSDSHWNEYVRWKPKKYSSSANARTEKCDRNQFLISIFMYLFHFFHSELHTRRCKHKTQRTKTNNKLIIEAIWSPHILWCIKLLVRAAKCCLTAEFLCMEHFKCKVELLGLADDVDCICSKATPMDRQWYSI